MPNEKKRILIIDDEIPIIDLVKLALEETGKYEVASECDPAKALEAARTFQPDLILLDLIMPEMTGSEVFRLLHQEPMLSRVPVIIVSALVSNFSTPGQPVEHDGYLLMGKPVQMDQLLRCVEDRLGKVA